MDLWIDTLSIISCEILLEPARSIWQRSIPRVTFSSLVHQGSWCLNLLASLQSLIIQLD